MMGDIVGVNVILFPLPFPLPPPPLFPPFPFPVGIIDANDIKISVDMHCHQGPQNVESFVTYPDLAIHGRSCDCQNSHFLVSIPGKAEVQMFRESAVYKLK